MKGRLLFALQLTYAGGRIAGIHAVADRDTIASLVTVLFGGQISRCLGLVVPPGVTSSVFVHTDTALPAPCVADETTSDRRDGWITTNCPRSARTAGR